MKSTGHGLSRRLGGFSVAGEGTRTRVAIGDGAQVDVVDLTVPGLDAMIMGGVAAPGGEWQAVEISASSRW